MFILTNIPLLTVIVLLSIELHSVLSFRVRYILASLDKDEFEGKNLVKNGDIHIGCCMLCVQGEGGSIV